MRMSTRVVWRGLMGCMAAGAMASAGCGWTARDEFLRSRSLALHAQPGDGSEISWNPTNQPGYRSAGAEVASRWDQSEK